MEIKTYLRTYEFEVIFDHTNQLLNVLVTINAHCEYQGENEVIVSDATNLWIADVYYQGQNPHIVSLLVLNRTDTDQLQDFVNLYNACVALKEMNNGKN